MNLKLPLIGLLVYCISLLAFTVDFLSEVTGWKLLSALPWILHEIFTLMTLVGLCVGMYFIARSYRLAASNTRYLAKQLDAAKGAFQSGIDEYFEEWGLSEAEKDIALLTIKGRCMPSCLSDRFFMSFARDSPQPIGCQGGHYQQIWLLRWHASGSRRHHLPNLSLNKPCSRKLSTMPSPITDTEINPR